MRKFWTILVGALLMSGLLPATAAHADAATYHLRSQFVSLGGGDGATIMGPDLIAGHIYFHQTFGDCATVECWVQGTWYVIDHDGNQLGGSYGGTSLPCFGSAGGDLAVNWGFGTYQSIRGQGTYSITETFATAECEVLGGGSQTPLSWSGDVNLAVTY